MKFISWNVNGIRACIKKGFLEFVEANNPDILCIQETKAHPEQVDLDLPIYEKYWNSAEKKGYSGTLILTKQIPLNVSLGLNILKHDKEGRVITLEYDDFFLVNVYTPNSKRDLSRLDYRFNEWNVDFLEHVMKLENVKPVIFCGDLNVAHKEIDLANPRTNKTTNSFRGNAGFTNKERQGFEDILAAGFLDTFREFSPDGGHYSWWSYRANARSRNIGWRIDYFCISSKLRPYLKQAYIQPNILGSDHCPIGIEMIWDN